MTDDRAVPMTPEERAAFRAELDVEARAAERAAAIVARKTDPRLPKVDASTKRQAAGPLIAVQSRERRREADEVERRAGRKLTPSERQARDLLGK